MSTMLSQWIEPFCYPFSLSWNYPSFHMLSFSLWYFVYNSYFYQEQPCLQSYYLSDNMVFLGSFHLVLDYLCDGFEKKSILLVVDKCYQLKVWTLWQYFFWYVVTFDVVTSNDYISFLKFQWCLSIWSLTSAQERK